MVADLARSGKSILMLGAWPASQGTCILLCTAQGSASCLHSSLPLSRQPTGGLKHGPPPPAVLQPCRPPGCGQDDGHPRDQPHAGG